MDDSLLELKEEVHTLSSRLSEVVAEFTSQREEDRERCVFAVLSVRWG